MQLPDKGRLTLAGRHHGAHAQQGKGHELLSSALQEITTQLAEDQARRGGQQPPMMEEMQAAASHCCPLAVNGQGSLRWLPHHLHGRALQAQLMARSSLHHSARLPT